MQGQVGCFNLFNPPVCTSNLCIVVVVVSVLASQGGRSGPPSSPQLWVDVISDLRSFRLQVHLLTSSDLP